MTNPDFSFISKPCVLHFAASNPKKNLHTSHQRTWCIDNALAVDIPLKLPLDRTGLTGGPGETPVVSPLDRGDDVYVYGWTFEESVSWGVVSWESKGPDPPEGHVLIFGLIKGRGWLIVP